jgi:hypothetical protein
MSVAVICGAGVDKSEGLDLPLAAELVPRIRDYLKSDSGREIDALLRELLPNLRFSYDKFIKTAIDKLSNEFRGQVADIVSNVSAVIDRAETSDADKKMGKLIVALLVKIQKLQNDVRLDDATEALIKAVFGDTFQVDDENIIDLPKLTFTDVFNNVMRQIFERSLNDPHNPVLKHVRGNLMDFERLLLDNFIGFYTNNESQIKNYLYLSWTLWAYLKHCESEAISRGGIIPFYNSLPSDWKLITLNYTSFSRKVFGDGNALYFHGDLSRFVRMHDRQLVKINRYDYLAPIDILTSILRPNLQFPKQGRASVIIPAIIPPLKLKPVLSNEYIDTWYKTKQALAEANRIVIVGYSFNYADEHFNDLIRCNKDKPIVVIDPCVEVVRDNLRNIYSHSASDYVTSSLQNHACFIKDKLRLIKSKATELEWNDPSLFE